MNETAVFADALEAVAGAPAPEFLQELREKGRESFRSLGLPNRRHEEWRFTRLKGIEKGGFDGTATVVAPRIDVTPWRIAGARLLVFVDGAFSPDVSDIGDLPDGVVVSNLVIGAASGSESVVEHLGSLAPLEHHPFAALNSALLADGATIHIPAGMELEKTIQLVFVSGSEDRSTVSAPRILIVAEEGSRATVVEQHLGNGGSLSCPVSEIVLGEKAVLEHVIVQEEDLSAHHLAVRQVKLAEGSRYSAQAISLGGSLARTDIGVVLAGEKAEASLDGLYLGDGSQQADTHLTMRHAAANCDSHQLYKGILGGKAKAVFNGRIIVDQDSQKTDANQSNRNLLLSDDAVVNSNPQLEIFADDVRCTHGSTVGQLDEEAVFYLRTRGIGRDEAVQLLTLAFAGEILDRIPVTALRERLEHVVAERLAAMTEEKISE